MPHYNQIHALYEQGQTPSQIAALINQPVDHVSLICDNIRIECKMRADGSDRYLERQKQIKDSGQVMEQDSVMAKIKRTLKPMAAAIEEATQQYTTGRIKTDIKVMSRVDPYQLAAITIRSVITAVTTGENKLTNNAANISKIVEPLYGEFLSKTDKIRLGHRLISLLCDNSDDCFKIAKQTTGRHGVYHVVSTENFDTWEQDHLDLMAELSVMYRPMVVTPAQWTGLHRGGYRNPNMQQAFIRNAPKLTSRTHGIRAIPRVYEAVNKIQNTRFTVNNFVLDVANTLISDPECTFKKFIQEIPQRPFTDKVSKLNERKEELETALGITTEKREALGKDFGQWVKDLLVSIRDGELYDLKIELEAVRFKIMQYVKWRKEVTSKRSKNRVAVTAVQVANEYSDYEALYIPHNLDWRGRVYPMCSGLTTQGTCLQKALIKFAEGKPIGSQKALYWLMVHTANSFGMDKASFQDRVKWTLDNEELIKRVAAKPITNLDDWKNTDDPWLFLAACEQMQKYYDHGLDAVVDISIPMDGTCNGAQHYAAMTRDLQGAYGVNVAPNGTQGVMARLAELRATSQTAPTQPLYDLLTVERNEAMKQLIAFTN